MKEHSLFNRKKFNILQHNKNLKGLDKVIVNKDKDQLTNIIKFNDKSLSNWHMAYISVSTLSCLG